MRCTLCVLALAAGLAAAATIRVPSQQSTIQAGLNAALSGDTVLVAPGNYKENLIWPARDGIKLVGEYGRDSTVIDGDSAGACITFQSGVVTRATEVRGFTITQGTRGIYLTAGAPTVADNRITANRGSLQGAGLYLSWSNAGFNPLITGNEIDGNVHRGVSGSGYRYGGGIYLYNTNASARPEICFNYIHHDTVEVVDHSYCRGGGIWAEGGVLIYGNVISANVCRGTGVSPWGNYTYGGGIYLTSSSSNAVPVVFGNLITANRSEANSYGFGGGIYNNCNTSAGNALILGNTIAGNVSQATGFPQGGGLYNTSNCKATLQNNIIAGNSAGSGAGIYNSTTGTTLLLSYNDYYNNALYNCTPGTGDITADPQFVSGGYRLSHVVAGQPITSPCVDAGAALPAGTGLNLDSLVHAWTTRTDDVPDAGVPDMGYHYVPAEPFDDVGVSHLLAPSGTVDSGAVVTPACSVYNYGSTTPASYSVRMKVEGGYDTVATVTSHAPGTAQYVTFPDWTASQRGTFGVSCSTELAGDINNANDKQSGSVDVQVIDAGVTQTLAPTGTVPLGTVVTPACSVYNYGTTTPTSYNVRMVIGAGYNNVMPIAGHVPGTWVYVTFPDWTADAVGEFAITNCTELPGDMNPGNDCDYDTVVVEDTAVVPPLTGWHEVGQVPLTPSGKLVKDGGWIAWDALTGKYYVAKGYKTGDFYSFEPVSRTWTQLADWPLGTEAKPPYKGSVGASDGNGVIYATKGNNTPGYWKYTADDSLGTWTQLADVPLGLSNKKVKGGTDMAYIGQDSSGSVYLLKGYKTEFYRYDVAAGTWQTLADAPAGVKAKYDKGSWLAHDETGRKLYAHKAKYMELYAYSLDSLTWGPMLPGMPLQNNQTTKSKKAKDGSDAVVINGKVYTLKGGNTIDFYTYDFATATWAEKETIPAFGTTGKKKRVKAGGSMASDGVYVLALKGNKTAELWLYGDAAPLAPAPQHSGVMDSKTLTRTGFQLGPNPLVGGVATLRYSLSVAGPAIVRVVDVTGRTVLTRSLALSRHGATDLDLRGLSAGVYLVRLESGSQSSSRKLVIE